MDVRESGGGSFYRYHVIAEALGNRPQGNDADGSCMQEAQGTLRRERREPWRLFRQVAIVVLVAVIYGRFMFDARVEYDRKSAQLLRRGRCPAPGVLNAPSSQSALGAQSAQFMSRYAVVIDAGSTGSRIHVYEFQFCGRRLLHLVDELFERVKPGLSAYSERHAEASESLEPLLRKAWRRVPRSLRRCTPLVLKATAGLRMLRRESVDGILNNVRTWLGRQSFHLPLGAGHASGDLSEAVSVIDGAEEAVSAWISVNFLQGNIGPPDAMSPSSETTIVLEMGGGSSQVVFDGAQHGTAAPAGSIIDVSVFSRRTRLYQHSYLGYGLMEARKQVKAAFVASDGGSGRPFPCFPTGHAETLRDGSRLTGASAGWDACARLVRDTLIHREAPCKLAPCSFNGVFQPTLPPTAPIYALSYIYERVHGLGLDVARGYTLGELRLRGERVCDAAFEANALHRQTGDFCLDLVFIHSLLHHGYGIGEERVIHSGTQISGYETSWTLGSALTVIESSPEVCFQ